MDLQRLVAEKLAAHEGESLPFAQYPQWPQRDPGFEAYRDAVVAEMSRRIGAKLQRLRTPPDQPRGGFREDERAYHP